MTEIPIKDPLIKVHKKDIREKFRESSEFLEEEIKKKGIKKKRPIRVIDLAREKDISASLQAMRGQYIASKLGSKMDIKLDSTLIPIRDLYSTCRLGFDGMKYNKKLVENKIKVITEIDKPSMKVYQSLLSPLGNFIIGHKVLKHYCPKFISHKDLEKSKKYYEKVKIEVNTIDMTLVDEPKVYHHDLTSKKRIYGVLPKPKKYQAPVLYNVDGKPVRYRDLVNMDELIDEYEASHWKKHALWRGSKTKAFREWLNLRGV